jgi:outer membrane protein W
MAAAFAAGTLLASAALAQTPTTPIGDGSWIISGSAGLSSHHDETSDRTTTSLRFAPAGMLFVLPRLAIGATLPLSYSSDDGGHATSFGIGPSARYYFGDQAGKLFPFLGASVLPQWQNSHRTSVGINGSPVDVDGSNRVISIDGSAGLTRLIATHVGVTGEAYYTHMSSKTDVGSSTSSRDAYDVGLRFGLTVFLY